LFTRTPVFCLARTAQGRPVGLARAYGGGCAGPFAGPSSRRTTDICASLRLPQRAGMGRPDGRKIRGARPDSRGWAGRSSARYVEWHRYRRRNGGTHLVADGMEGTPPLVKGTKSEARNAKHEIRNEFETANTREEGEQRPGRVGHLRVSSSLLLCRFSAASDFESVSDFEFRVSDLPGGRVPASPGASQDKSPALPPGWFT